MPYYYFFDFFFFGGGGGVMVGLRPIHVTKAKRCPKNAASDMGSHCLLRRITNDNEMEMQYI